MLWLCGYSDLSQIYLRATRTLYPRLEPYLINYLLIYLYLSQLSSYTDPQSKSANNYL